MDGTDIPCVQPKIRRVNLDTGRENVVVISRHSRALRPEIFRGFSRVELRRDAKIRGLSDTIADRLVPSAKIFLPLLDDIYDLSTNAPTNLNAANRRRLTPESVVALDWHNDMSKLILDINERVAAAADDRARDVVIRRLRRALDPEH